LKVDCNHIHAGLNINKLFTFIASKKMLRGRSWHVIHSFKLGINNSKHKITCTHLRRKL